MSARLAAAAYLALGFAVISYVAVFVEPGMGFVTMGDFLDPTKVSVGFRSTWWRIENPMYLAFPVAFWVLARHSDDRYLVWSGVTAGVLFFLVGAFDRTMMQVPALRPASGPTAVIAAILPVRFAVLKSTVAAIGVFAWRTTRTGLGTGVANKAWRALGYVALAINVAFVFVFLPAPVVVMIWAMALTAREALAPAAA